jgi:NADPH2:quinone reductase
MRALVCHAVTGTLDVSVDDVADPVAGPGQVVVRVAAASVDFVDTLIARGRYQIPVPVPFTPGNSVAGEVVAVGPGATRLAVGDRVHGMAMIGGHAEQVALAEDRLRRTPAGLSPDLACVTGSTYRTAYDVLVTTAGVRPGERVVVLGASGAVGSAAITVAKALGATVIACASTERKLGFCRELGADEVVNYDEVDLKSALKALGGADVVLDMVGGDHSEAALRATGYGGRYVVIGFAAGAIPKVPLNLVLLKGSLVTGYEIGDFERHQPDVAAANRDALEAMIADGRVTPPITARFPLAQAAEAMAHVAGRDKFGATILDLRA